MDSDNRRSESIDQCDIGNNMRSSLILATKLISVLIIVTILSIGSVLLSGLFVWLCFKYPQSGTVLLQVLIPTAVSGIAIYYGKKLLATLAHDVELIEPGKK